jgi:hypothetical protein
MLSCVQTGGRLRQKGDGRCSNGQSQAARSTPRRAASAAVRRPASAAKSEEPSPSGRPRLGSGAYAALDSGELPDASPWHRATYGDADAYELMGAAPLGIRLTTGHASCCHVTDAWHTPVEPGSLQHVA